VPRQRRVRWQSGGGNCSPRRKRRSSSRPSTPTTRRSRTPSGKALEVLLGLKEEGLIEHLGAAGGPIDLMIRYTRTGFFEAVITHNRYTLVNSTAELMLDGAAELGVATLNAAPYGSALRQRHTGEGSGRIRPLRVRRSVRRSGRTGAKDAKRMPAVRRSPGRCGPAILLARSARGLDHSRDQPPGAHRPDTRLSHPSRSRGAVGEAGVNNGNRQQV
jgi:hypothetical protein